MKISELKRICEEATPKILDGLSVPTNNALYHHSITPSRVKKMLELLERASELCDIRCTGVIDEDHDAWLQDFEREFGE